MRLSCHAYRDRLLTTLSRIIWKERADFFYKNITWAPCANNFVLCLERHLGSNEPAGHSDCRARKCRCDGIDGALNGNCKKEKCQLRHTAGAQHSGYTIQFAWHTQPQESERENKAKTERKWLCLDKSHEPSWWTWTFQKKIILLLCKKGLWTISNIWCAFRIQAFIIPQTWLLDGRFPQRTQMHTSRTIQIDCLRKISC
jgi:hypothetical protein